ISTSAAQTSIHALSPALLASVICCCSCAMRASCGEALPAVAVPATCASTECDRMTTRKKIPSLIFMGQNRSLATRIFNVAVGGKRRKLKQFIEGIEDIYCCRQLDARANSIYNLRQRRLRPPLLNC